MVVEGIVYTLALGAYHDCGVYVYIMKIHGGLGYESMDCARLTEGSGYLQSTQ